MQLEERIVGDVTVLALSGRMTRDAEYGVLIYAGHWYADSRVCPGTRSRWRSRSHPAVGSVSDHDGRDGPLTMPLQPGTTLGSYSVTAKIGEGGMGEVSGTRARGHTAALPLGTRPG